MARVEIAAQPWGVITDHYGTGDAANTVTIADLAGTAAPTYTTATGSVAASKVTDSNGRIPGFIEEGTYTVTYSTGGTTASYTVEAVSGRPGGVFNAKAYGATGDGTTNDQVALQAWLTAATGATAYLPPGSYVCTGLTVPTGTEVVGAGWSSVLKVSPSTGTYPLKVAPSSTDVRLRDFAVNGNKANVAGNSDSSGDPNTAIMVGGADPATPCQRIYVERVKVHDSKRLGISFQNVQTGAVRDCLVQDNARDGITLYFNCRDIGITGNTVLRCADDYIGINSEDVDTTGHLCERIVVANNVLTGPGVGQGAVNKGRGMTVRGGKSINIANNVITDVCQAAIVLNDFLSTACTDIVIASNTIDRPGYLGVSEKDGIRIETTSTGTGGIQRVSVKLNTIRGALQHGIRLHNGQSSKADDDIRDIAIRSNEIYSATETGIAIDTGVGVNDVTIDSNLVEGCGTGGIIVDAGVLKRIYVRANQVLRNTGYGIKMRQIAAGALEGNHVYDDRGGSATQTHGINIFTLTGVFSFGRNTAWGNSTANYLDDGSHTATYTDGAFGKVPIALPGTYAATNVTTDRTYDANATTVDELADVLGTLIADLRAEGWVG